MVELLSSYDINYPRNDVQQLYNENKKYFFDTEYEKLEKLLKGNIWAVVEDGKTYGALYLEEKDNKYYMSGFSDRKAFKVVAESINIFCNHYFNVLGINEIYSKTEYLHAKLALKRAGFERVTSDIYRKEN